MAREGRPAVRLEVGGVAFGAEGSDPGAFGNPADFGKDLAARRTLERLGFTWHGAEFWKPPLGAAPDFDLLDAKQAELDRLQTRARELEVSLAGLLQWFGADGHGRQWMPFSQVFKARLLVGMDTVPDDPAD